MLNKIPKLFNFMIPDFTLPPIFATIGEKLPQFPHGLMLCAALNIANKLQLLANQDLKKLDSEHNALQTEYESLKSVIDNNVERSFKAFS